jgi:hypothetical protein
MAFVSPDTPSFTTSLRPALPSPRREKHPAPGLRAPLLCPPMSPMLEAMLSHFPWWCPPLSNFAPAQPLWICWQEPWPRGQRAQRAEGTDLNPPLSSTLRTLLPSTEQTCSGAVLPGFTLAVVCPGYFWLLFPYLSAGFADFCQTAVRPSAETSLLEGVVPNPSLSPTWVPALPTPGHWVPSPASVSFPICNKIHNQC